MMKPIHTLLTLGAFGIAAVVAQAQPAPKIVVVNMAKIFDNHYDTLAEKAKLDDATKKAQEQIDAMNKEGDAMVAVYKELDEQSKNPTATADAKAKAAADAQKKGQEIQAKLNDRNNLAQNAKATIQDRIQKFRTMMLEEISKKVVAVAKTHGATLVLDESGPTLLGVSPVLYVDPAYDITDEVMAEINKDRPAGAPTSAPASAPSMTASPAPSSSSDSSKLVVPGVTAPAK